jgi:erythromycin esterase
LQWIFEYNQNPNNIKKVTFFGIDIVAPNDALEQIFEYLQKVNEPYFTEVQNRNFARSIIEDYFWPATRQNYTELTVNEKQALSESYTELFEHIIHNKDSYVASSSVQKYEWIKQLSYSAKEANRMFSENDQLAMGLIRDRAMANIALWIKERNEKTIIWAHNVHIAKSEFTMSILPGSKIKGMGYFLNQELIDRMVSIAASFNQGSFRNENKNFEPAGIHTIDGALATLDMEYFILDLNGKSKHDNVEQWLNTDQIIRGQDFEMICVPAEAFDAIYYTADISRVNYNPTTLERKRN